MRDSAMQDPADARVVIKMTKTEAAIREQLKQETNTARRQELIKSLWKLTLRNRESSRRRSIQNSGIA